MLPLHKGAWIFTVASGLSKYQQAYRWNFRPNVRYIVDCSSGELGTCQDFCNANQLLDSDNDPLYVSKPVLEDWLDSWPENCVYNLISKESLNSLNSGFLRHKTTRYGGFGSAASTADTGFFSHTLLIEPSGNQNNALFSHLDKIVVKSVANVGDQPFYDSLTDLKTQVCLVASGIDSHFTTDCLYDSLSALDTDFVILSGTSNLSVWTNVKNWKTVDYFVDEDITSDYDPDDPGDRRLYYTSGQLITDITIDFNQTSSQSGSLEEVFSESGFGDRYFDTRSELGGWIDFLNPLNCSSWLGVDQDNAVIHAGKIPGRAFSMTITVPLTKATMAQWSGTLQTVKTRMTIYSRSDYRVQTGANSEILPWYDTQYFSTEKSANEVSRCPSDMYSCSGVNDLVRHDQWFDPDVQYETDVYYRSRTHRCARDLLSCPGPLIDKQFKDLTANLTFFAGVSSLAQQKSI